MAIFHSYVTVITSGPMSVSTSSKEQRQGLDVAGTAIVLEPKRPHDVWRSQHHPKETAKSALFLRLCRAKNV